MTTLKIFKGINLVGPDACFIRLKNDPTYLAHFKGEREEGEVIEIDIEFKVGHVGAICFINDQADKFFEMAGEASRDLEKVKITDVVPPDGSLN